MLDRLPQSILESVASIPLPPLPPVLVRFVTLIEDERTPLKELAALVALDPAFTAQLLTLASSPPYRQETTGISLEQSMAALVALDPAFTAQLLTLASSPPYRQETTGISLEQSMAALGLPLLRTLTACMTAQNVQLQTFYDCNLDYPGYWCHSLRVAAMARSLADAAGYRDAGEAYLAGLLHDIGQLLLLGGVGDFCAILPATNGLETGLAGLTQTVAAVDHVSLACRLVDSWQLSSFMADALLFHRFPAEEIVSADLLCRIVWAAHSLSCCGEDIGAAIDLSPEISAIPALLGIDAVTIVKACETSRAFAAEQAAFFGVQILAAEPVLPGHKFIYPYVTLPKRDVRDSARLHLDALMRNQAVMQPLQQTLSSLSSEAELYGSLRETARLLFGLQRPVFLLPLPDRPVLVAAAVAGQAPLLARLEISLEQGRSLVAEALQTGRPCASFSDEVKPTASLVDIQLARLLGSQGLLCVPMGTGGQQVGVMVFGLSKEQYAGKWRLVEGMTGFARLAARSLEMFRSAQQRDQMISADLSRKFEQRARKVIHEVVNPLGIINNYLEIFAEKLGDSPEIQQELTILKDEISRVERIVRGLNDLPEQLLPVETVNVNSLIEGMLALYGESLFESAGIDIHKQLDPGFPLVKADRDSLKQILFNLWKNSAEAMPAGGSFRIFTCGTGQDNACCSVEIRLSDSGPGIPEDVKERLFQPLAPDRRPANFGVGLSIVASLVQRLGGQISCDSSPQAGTTFTIRLAKA